MTNQDSPHLPAAPDVKLRERPDGGMPKVDLRAAPKVKHRLGVVEQVYHQAADGMPASFDSRFGRELESDEQMYVRKGTVGEVWQPLDTGWLDEAGMIVLRNEEGIFRVIPTPEERARAAKKIIMVAARDPDPDEVKLVAFALIPPGESMRLMPANLKGIMISSLDQAGSIKFTLAVVPK